MSNQSLSQYDLSVKPMYVLVDERPSPFARAEQVKREYSAQLKQLLTDAEFALTVALGIDPLNPDGASAYHLAELAGYIHRITRPARQVERRLDEAAAEAEQDERA